ncbi:MAG: RIP metalloprotease RseP [Blastomonas sp.]|uniref:RIP metalloprotease RseP n=1 Tax=Blastomonas TaxID=150203 RepID=UPI0024E2153F|nr:MULTISPECIES: RIP metalloprotease RseP [Blastomonas]MCO5793223.1 RIP metalloprotease RseP [Blastomonas sp.]MDK2758871.1 RIP metalloprotease RseP [Blastomonas fulva]
MSENPGFLLTVLAFLLVLGPLVFVHEMGHYLVGRWFGVKAESFSIGFGREIAGWTDKRGTRWKLGMLPLGGYVQFAGDMDPSSRANPDWVALPAEERNRTFQSKTLWQRALIVFAGPAINFLFAILILAGFAFAYGKSVTPPVVAALVPSSAAAEAGLLPGDKIVSIDGEAVEWFDEVGRKIAHRPGERITMRAERDGAIREFSFPIGVEIQKDRFDNEYRIGRLGIMSAKPVVRPVSLLEAPVVAVQRTGDIVQLMVATLGQVITGRRSVAELGGPLKIAQVSGEQLSAGLDDFIFFIALISINLGFINLLPIPMLDGGHLLFYAVEAIRRKPANPRVMEWAFRSGLAAVLALMVFVTVNDLASFGLLG